MPPPATRLAIDLSGGLIRVLEGSLGGPIRSGSGGTPPGSLVDGRILDVNAVGGALRQLVARTEIKGTHALVAASDAVATFRVLRLPRSASEKDVGAAVARELALDPERMSTQWVDVPTQEDERRIYAVAWDSALVNGITAATRAAGLEPIAVDLKSACIARTAPESACVVVDMASDPVDVFLIDRNVPQVWHSFRMDRAAGDDVGPSLVGPLRSVLRFYKRRRDTNFLPAAPILIASDQSISSASAEWLHRMVGHPVTNLPLPPRVPTDLRHATYLTCLGLVMRRT